MVVPNLLFDLIVYGALWVGVLLDVFVPALHGAATLIAVCTATYLAAEDGCIALSRRGWWTQESLATALSLSTAAFIYYWWRNDSDLMAVVLHIGLMMASLMILIAVVAAFSAAAHKKSPLPVLSLLATAAGSILLGILAGWSIFLLTSATVSLPIKIVLLLVGAVGWKVRESLSPPQQNDDSFTTGKAETAAPPASVTPGMSSPNVEHPGAKRIFIPQRGTLLDRFLPVLVLCIVAFVALKSAMGVVVR